MKKIKILTIASLLAIVLSNFVYADELDNFEKVTVTTSEKVFDTGFKANMGNITYVTPAQSYDFFDENDIYNTVYRSDNKIYWSKYNDEDKELYDTKEIEIYYNLKSKLL